MNIHIAFGESPAGSLKVALREMKTMDPYKVISVSDIFSIGPIQGLDTEEGIAKRTEWFKDRFSNDPLDPHYEKEYKREINEAIQNVQRIGEDDHITIWAGDNAHEQVGLSFTMFLLRERTSPIRVINTNHAYEQYCKEEDIFSFPLYTGEVSPEKIKVIIENSQDDGQFSEEERRKLEKKWLEISKNAGNLRLWEDDQVLFVDEDYLDSLFIQHAKELHLKPGKAGFMKSARLIGTVLGHLEQYVGDAFLEYRLRKLIEEGIFEYEGSLEAMRYYNVKLIK
jgi:hypothetical protein